MAFKNGDHVQKKSAQYILALDNTIMHNNRDHCAQKGHAYNNERRFPRRRGLL